MKEKPNYKSVAIDETQQFYMKPKDLKEVKKIWICYFVNFAERTFCCEVTPSYWLEPVSFFIEYTDKVINEKDQYKQELCFEYWEDTVRKTLSEGCYMHCHTIVEKSNLKIADYVLPENTLQAIESGNIEDKDLLEGVEEYFHNYTPGIREGKLQLI